MLEQSLRRVGKGLTALIAPMSGEATCPRDEGGLPGPIHRSLGAAAVAGRVPARPARERAIRHGGHDLLQAIASGELAEGQPALGETRCRDGAGDDVVPSRSTGAGASTTTAFSRAWSSWLPQR
jgi:hypothetical protein